VFVRFADNDGMVARNVGFERLHIVRIDDAISFLETNGLATDILQRSLYIPEITDQFEYIMIDVLTVERVNDDRRSCRQMLQRELDAGLVQERNFFRQMDQDRFTIVILFFVKEIGVLIIPVQQRKYAYTQADTHAHQQIREDDGKDCRVYNRS